MKWYFWLILGVAVVAVGFATYKMLQPATSEGTE